MRYVVLVILNLPIILSALVNIVTQYKLRRVSAARFRHQLIIWLILLVLLLASFPVYNVLTGRPLLDSTELSSFDILQVTALVLLFYVVNAQRQRIDQQEKRLRDLHQTLSIRLSRHNEKDN